MEPQTDCKREIETLHEFFTDWYAGETDSDAIDRLSNALAHEFEMVDPDGNRRPRAEVIEMVETGYGQYEPGEFSIAIEHVELRWASDDHALVRYEEHQFGSDDTTVRLSTALFAAKPTAPNGVVWRDLHETFQDG